MTCDPAPIAKSISVAVADNDTIFVGRDGAADDDAVATAGLESLPHAATSAAARQRARSRLRKVFPPLFESGDLDGRGKALSHERPFSSRAVFVHHWPGDLAHPPRRLHSCGTAPGSHRTSLHQRYGRDPTRWSVFDALDRLDAGVERVLHLAHLGDRVGDGNELLWGIATR